MRETVTLHENGRDDVGWRTGQTEERWPAASSIVERGRHPAFVAKPM